MSVIPSWGVQTFPGTTVYGPVMAADLKQFPVLAARMSEEKPTHTTTCFSVEGPDKCNDLTAWTYEYLDECSFVLDDCDKLLERSITDDEDDFEDAKADKDEDSNQYGFEENKEHDDYGSPTFGDIIDGVKDHFEDAEEQDQEDTKEHDFEDADEPDSTDQEHGSVSSEPDFGYSSSTPAFGYSSSTSEFGYSTSAPNFGYSSSTPVDEGYDYLPVVTKAFKVARQLSSGIPQSVQDALINDPNAPSSLAAQFTDGADTPDWYDNLPQEQQEMFLTERADEPAATTMTLTTQGTTTMTIISDGQTVTTTMTTQGATPTTVTPAPTTTGFGYRGYSDPVCDNPSGNVTQSCIELAVSSQVADHYSRIATDMFQAASSISCSALSSAASTVAEDAASASERASAARSSLSCDNVSGNATNVNKDAVGVGAASPAVLVPKSSAVFAVSLTVAVATLGLALYL